jgi:hypothetical protein
MLKKMLIFVSALLILAAWLPAAATASEESESGVEFVKGLDGLSIGGLWYLSYQDGETGGEDFSKFVVKRGYINIEKEILRWKGGTVLEGRITPDVHQDDEGDLKVRLKYAYGKFKWQGMQWQPWLEMGVVHMPWLDFEEHINLFRMQDTLFVERNGTFNSADFGLTFGGFIGPKLDGLKYYPGKYGSFSVGIYNGGGYHAKEANTGKVIEGRLTVRPFPGTVRGLQFSYFGLTGEGNTAEEPDWTVNMGMVSYEFDRGVVTATYYAGDGNQKGSAVDENGDALARDGYSFFGEVRLLESKAFSLFGRYDDFDFDTDVDNDGLTRTIAGVAYDLGHHNTFVLDWDHADYEDDRDADDRIQLTLQVKF